MFIPIITIFLVLKNTFTSLWRCFRQGPCRGGK